MFYKDIPLIKRLSDEVDYESDSVTLLRETWDNKEYYQIHMVFDPEDKDFDPDPYFLVVDSAGYAIYCSDEYDEAIAQAEAHIHSAWLLKTLTESETGGHYVDDEPHTIN